MVDRVDDRHFGRFACSTQELKKFMVLIIGSAVSHEMTTDSLKSARVRAAGWSAIILFHEVEISSKGTNKERQRQSIHTQECWFRTVMRCVSSIAALNLRRTSLPFGFCFDRGIKYHGGVSVRFLFRVDRKCVWSEWVRLHEIKMDSENCVLI